MRQPYVLGRFLWASLLLYLIGLSGLALWAGVRTAAQSEVTHRLVILSDGWKDARYWVAQEETLERKELLTPASYVRRLHAHAVSWVSRVATELGDRGTAEDRRHVAIIIAANARYRRAMKASFDAVEAHDAARVAAIHDAIDPTYDLIEHEVDAEGSVYHRAAYLSIAELGRTQAVVVWATPITAMLGLLVLAAFFILLEGYKRRFEAARRAEMERLERAARCDALTTLGNHRAFQETFRRLVGQARAGDGGLALGLVDVDDFKLVNDRRGHRHGDTVLATLGGLLHEHFPALAYRIGGDEFAVLLPGVPLVDTVARFERLRTAAHAGLFGATVSIGIAELPAGAVDAELLFEQADAALYEAKHRGRNAAAVAAPGAPAGASTRSSLKRGALAALIDGRRTSIVQQPIWDLKGAEILGYEALTRFASDVALDGPAEAFAVAESLGRAHELDALCLRVIAEEAVVDAGHLLFVNVSPQSIRDGALADELLAPLLARMPVLPNRLVLELTEHSITSGAAAIEQLERFSRRGVRFALDDMASANAGLEVLGSLPVHFVKVDGSVVRRAAGEPRMAAVLVGILATARELDADVVLEGIEDDAILQTAVRSVMRTRTLGRVALQGYYLGRPGVGRLLSEPHARYRARLQSALAVASGPALASAR